MSESSKWPWAALHHGKLLTKLSNFDYWDCHRQLAHCPLDWLHVHSYCSKQIHEKRLVYVLLHFRSHRLPRWAMKIYLISGTATSLPSKVSVRIVTGKNDRMFPFWSHKDFYCAFSATILIHRLPSYNRVLIISMSTTCRPALLPLHRPNIRSTWCWFRCSYSGYRYCEVGILGTPRLIHIWGMTLPLDVDSYPHISLGYLRGSFRNHWAVTCMDIDVRSMLTMVWSSEHILWAWQGLW